MTDLDKLKQTYKDLGIDFVVRENGTFSYLFIGKPEHASGVKYPEDDFETTDLDLLTMRNKFFEFEDGWLISW